MPWWLVSLSNPTMQNPHIVLSADANGALLLPAITGFPGVVVTREHLSFFCENPTTAPVSTISPFAAGILGDTLSARGIQFLRIEKDLILYPEEEVVDIVTTDGLAIRCFDPPQHHLLARKLSGDIVITSRLALIVGRDKLPIILRAHTPPQTSVAHAKNRFSGLGEISELPRLLSDAWHKAFGWAPPPVDPRQCSLWRS